MRAWAERGRVQGPGRAENYRGHPRAGCWHGLCGLYGGGRNYPPATAAVHLLFAAGLHRVSVARAATVSLAEPLTAAILGVALLAERLTTAGVVGAAVLVAGLAVLAAPSQTAATRPPSPGHRR